ncbi:unnamed protein product, partial [Closterium sp. NIES-53]
ASGELFFSWNMRFPPTQYSARLPPEYLNPPLPPPSLPLFPRLPPSHHPPGASGELFFSWNMRLKVAVQVAEALAYMHGLNFIHRDLKAANVLLSPDYDAKLTDFGMVRVGPEGQLESIVSTRIMGTEGYIDPTYMETGVCLYKGL